MRIKVAPNASSAMVSPPEAEPVIAESKLVATASETSGPAFDRQHPVTHNGEGRYVGDDGAKADQAR